MTSPNIGPAARQMADAMGAAEKPIRSEVEKLRKKLRDKLPAKQRKRFDKNWKKAGKDVKKQSDAVYLLFDMVRHRAILDEATEDPEYLEMLEEIRLLTDMLRGLETLENLEKHFDALAKIYGS